MEVAARVKNALTQTVFRRFVELALPLSVDVVRSFGVHIDWGDAPQLCDFTWPVWPNLEPLLVFCAVRASFN